MRIRTGTQVAAPVATVYGVYADYRSWPTLFPTIRGVRRVGGDGDAVLLAIDHVEGTVSNVLHLHPPDRIVLVERKRAYDGTFVNTFTATDAGTRFEVDAEISLNGWRRPLAPLVRPYARRLVQRLQIAPVKAAAEDRG
jgi:hypothetical protein